jgi:L-ascorbate metabolism protein UlaG (beta-lactamase superfamily)
VSRIAFVGHSTVLVELAGTRLLTDPVLRGRVAHLRRIVPVPAASGLTDPDGVLISHAHFDHLDLPSLRRLTSTVRVVVPRGWARLAGRAGLRNVTEVEVGDRVVIGEVGVRATPARHDGHRLPLGRAARALGYVIEGSRRVYFAGDTDIFEGMGELADDLDVALLPVSGWGRTLPPGHLNPERAARALELLRPRIAVPIHWGTFTSPGASRGEPDQPAREFARLAASCAPDVEVRMLHPGDSMSLA